MSDAANVKLKVAVLSFAHGHAGGYLRNLAGREDLELLAADPDRIGSPDSDGRGPELAAELGIAYVDSYDEAFAWQPDAVVICSENTRHRALAERAAAAGADILCEKPLATTVEDAEAMVATAERYGVSLMVAFPVRFSPAFTALKSRIAAGQLGDVLSILATNNGKLPIADRRWFVDPALSGGGSLVDHIVHCADLIDALLGQRATSVRAVSNRIMHADLDLKVETGGIANLIYASGIIATIDCSWSHPNSAPNWGGLTLEVVGTNGSITINPFASHVGGFGPDGALWLPYGTDLDDELIGEFLTAVRERRQPQPDGNVGVRTVAIMAAAQRSARDGQLVTL